MIYGVISDVHAHAWSAFSQLTPEGLNSRLVATLNEVERAADETVAAGGEYLVLAGDLFHSRGSLDPEVFNLTHETFTRILDKHDGQLEVLALPGNHDLKSDETRELSNAFASFKALKGFRTFHEPTIFQGLAFVPWRKNVKDLLEDIDKMGSAWPSKALGEVDLFIHAGIDGVLSGMPAHGLTAAALEAFGFRRVFAGHYHNHRILSDRVISIGAIAHQTYSDIGTKAGFLLVDDAKVNYRASRAPNFVDVSGLDESDMALEADGNFVRYRGENLADSHVRALREFFEKAGAKGVSIEGTREKASARGTAVQAKGVTLEQSVDSFADNAFVSAPPARQAAIKREAASILTSVRSLAA